MNAKTSTAAAGPARRPLPGSTASVAGARVLMAAAQSVFLSGHVSAGFDF
ncbi:MAG: hypothetical protein WBG11_15310 [Methylocella sp.]